MNYVIFKELGKYKMTNEDNYNARIRDANKVVTFVGANSFADCIASLPRYYGANYIDKTGD